MNIFWLSWNIKECAQYHFDKHVIKMILETAQLLSCAYWMCESLEKAKELNENNLIYRKTHHNHPCAIWVREHINNFVLCAQLGLELCKEYTFRYKKIHITQRRIEWMINNPPSLSSLPIHICEECKIKSGCPHIITKPPICITNKDYHTSSIIESYRVYYQSPEKSHIRSYKNRNFPSWFKTKVIDNFY